MKRSILFAILLVCMSCTRQHALHIAEQGSFAVGGTVLRDSAGHTYHGDHAYVFYQKPVHARPLPMVFAHGVGSSPRHGRPRPTDARGSRTSFSAEAMPSTSLTSPDGAMRGAAPRASRSPRSSTRRYGSTVSASVSIPTISTACSSTAARRRSTSSSGR